MNNKRNYNGNNYELTINHENEKYVTIQATDEFSTKTSNTFFMKCEQEIFKEFLECLDAGAGRMILTGYIPFEGVYTHVTVYDNINDNIIGQFHMNSFRREGKEEMHKWVEVRPDEVKNIFNIAYGLYQKKLTSQEGDPNNKECIKITAGLNVDEIGIGHYEPISQYNNPLVTATDYCKAHLRENLIKEQERREAECKQSFKPSPGKFHLKNVRFDYNAEQYDISIDVLPNTADRVINIRANDSEDMGDGDVQFSLSCYWKTFHQIIGDLVTANRLELHELEKADGVYTCITIYDSNTGDSTDYPIMGATLEGNDTIVTGRNLRRLFLLVNELLYEWNCTHAPKSNGRIYSEGIKAVEEQLKKYGKDFNFYGEGQEHPL